jgi:hypothetical protein
MKSIITKILSYLFIGNKPIQEMLCRTTAQYEDKFVLPKAKTMKTLIANKQTDEQKRANEFARYQFIMAMMNMDEKTLIPLLKKDGKFLGHLNTWQFLNWLRNQFNTLNPIMFHSKFKEGVSLDYYPGSDIFEFSYAPMGDNSDNDPFFNEEQDEESIFNSKMVFQIKLVLLFENGKIADIRVPKKVACLEKTKRFQLEN